MKKTIIEIYRKQTIESDQNVQALFLSARKLITTLERVKDRLPEAIRLDIAFGGFGELEASIKAVHRAYPGMKDRIDEKLKRAEEERAANDG